MRATLADLHVAIQPGTPASVDVELVNTDAAIDGVAVTVRGIDPAYVRVEPPLLPLFPTTSATVTVTFDVPRTYPAGDTPLMVVATSMVDPDRHVERDVLLHVGEVRDARVEMRPSVVTGGRNGRFVATVHNTGNVGLDARLSASESSRSLECRVTPPVDHLIAGEQASFVIDVGGRRPWFGQVLARSIRVVVETDEDQREVEVRFQQKPRIPWGAITAAILAAIILLWALIFLFVIRWLTSDGSREKAVPKNWNAHGVQEIPIDAIGASMEGTVTAASTGEVLPRITVEAFRIKHTAQGDVPEAAGSAATDDDGAYSLAALLPGSYQLRFSADGYEPLWYPGVADEADADVITVEPLATLQRMDMVLTGKPGGMRGTIPAVPGAPGGATTVTVTLLPQHPDDPVPEPVTITTDGPFEVSGLTTPGTYSVTVARPGFDPQTAVVTLAGGATPTIQPDQLRAAPGTVSGTVVSSGGVPLGGVTVTLRGGTTELVATTPTAGAVGTFSMSNLPTPGTYVLTFERDGYSSATVALDLGGGESRDGVRAVLNGGVGTVSGVVRDASGNPLGGAVVAASGTTSASTTSVSGGEGAGPGSYTMTGLVAPGTYTFSFTLTGYEPATIPVTLDATGAMSGVDVVMRASSGSVRGTVYNGPGAVAGAVVQLSDGASGQSTMSSSSPLGGYEFVGVAPGDYTVTASLTIGSDTRRVVALIHVDAGAVVTTMLDVATGATG